MSLANPKRATSVGRIYFEAGLSPIRIAERGKKPIDTGWTTAPIDAAEVDAWLAQGGNVGLRMGLQPSGRMLLALDEDAPDEFERAEAAIGPLPLTLSARTGSGGEHRFYSWPSGVPVPGNNVRTQGFKIDVRSQGGQVVAAPSIHPSGGQYTWIAGADDPAQIAELPAAWVELLRSDAPDEHDDREAPTDIPECDLTPELRAALDRFAAAIEPHYVAGNGDGSGNTHEMSRAISGGLRTVRAPMSAAEYVVLERLRTPDEKGQKPKNIAEAYEHEHPAAFGVLKRLLGPAHWPAVQAAANAVELAYARARVSARPRGERVSRWEPDGMVLFNSSDPADAALLGPQPGPANDALWEQQAKAEPSAAEDNPFGIVGCLLEPGDCAPPDYICEALGIFAYQGKVSLIGAESHGGKTPLEVHLAICIAGGHRIFGEHAVQRPCSVAILSFEGARALERMIQRQCRAMGVPRPPNLYVVSADPPNLKSLQSGTWIAPLAAACKRFGVGAVFVDTYTTAMLSAGCDPNKPEFAIMLSQLATLGVYVGALVHFNKPGKGKEARPKLTDVAGTFALAALCVSAIGLWRPDPDDRYRIEVCCLRQNEGEAFKPMQIVWYDVDGKAGLGVRLEGRETPSARREAESHAKAQKRATRLLGAARSILTEMVRNPVHPMAIRGIKSATGVHERDSRPALEVLVRKVVVRRTDVPGTGAHTYQLARLPDPGDVRPAEARWELGVQDFWLAAVDAESQGA